MTYDRDEPRRTSRLLIMLLALLGLMVSCGDGGPTTANSTSSPPDSADAADTPPAQDTEQVAASEAELQPVRGAIVPVINAAPLFVGRAAGIFEAHGLDLEVEIIQEGPAVVAAALGGSVDVGHIAIPPILLARSQGVPLQLIASSDLIHEDVDQDGSGLLVLADSGIESVADLTGRTVAVNALRSMVELTVRMAIDANGGDSSAVNYLEMPFPDMSEALRSGQVDAIAVVEPFFTLGSSDGVRVLLRPFAEAYPAGPVSGFFVSEAFAAENPELVDTLTAAITEAVDYAAENPDAVRDAIAEYTQVPEQAIGQLLLPDFGGSFETASFAPWVDAMLDYGFVESPPDIDGLIR